MPTPKRNSKPAPALKVNDESKTFEESANLVKSLIDYLISRGCTVPEALKRATLLTSKPGYSLDADIGTISQSEYNGAALKREDMATATAVKRPAKKSKMPKGTKFCERFARGLIRWRLRQGLSVKVAHTKYGIDRNAWYRTEQALSNGQTATHIDDICLAIGVEDSQILIWGRSE